ncbi:hypothetical protein RRG08_029407 [Elysia crispata]|uniref:Uncharacterized protein n=1 Tax=Elysia crispata TaxID=231223 RepID=A0AAE0Z0L2_9GAST|nr:hypothetical protein RRG08_029407 [Elysia crispata]
MGATARIYSYLDGFNDVVKLRRLLCKPSVAVAHYSEQSFIVLDQAFDDSSGSEYMSCARINNWMLPLYKKKKKEI